MFYALKNIYKIIWFKFRTASPCLKALGQFLCAILVALSSFSPLRNEPHTWSEWSHLHRSQIEESSPSTPLSGLCHYESPLLSIVHIPNVEVFKSILAIVSYILQDSPGVLFLAHNLFIKQILFYLKIKNLNFFVDFLWIWKQDIQ